jgi:phosphoheptose isomerase
MKDIIAIEFNTHIYSINSLNNLTDAEANSAKLCIECIKNGDKILIFGNVCSAADA